MDTLGELDYQREIPKLKRQLQDQHVKMFAVLQKKRSLVASLITSCYVFQHNAGWDRDALF